MGGQYEGGPVLLAEDDPGILGPVREALRAEGLLVISSRTIHSALEAADFHRPSVVVLDVAMDGGRGWELLHGGASRSGTRVLVLDRAGDGSVRRAAFGAGADDVASAPIVPFEVAARVRSLARRDRVDPLGPVLRHGDLVVDVPSHEVRLGGQPIPVTAQQFAILRALCEARGATLHRAQLLARIAALEDEPPSDRAVDLHVSRLRRRLGKRGRRYIQAVYGIGYRLAAPDPRPMLSPDTASAVLDAIGSGVLVIDDGLRIQAANRTALRLFEGEDVIGRSCHEVLRCHTPAGVAMTGPMCLGAAVLAGDAPIPNVNVLIRSNGDRVAVDLSHAPIAADDGSRLVAVEIQRPPA